jgi:NAD+ synthase (glutamine-hydrolysing)
MPRARLALCQMNTVVGDIDANAQQILRAMSQAEDEGADLVAFPELAVTGYPPEDLLLKPAFVAGNLAALAELAKASRRCVALIGFVDLVGQELSEPKRSRPGPRSVAQDLARNALMSPDSRVLRNSLAVCAGGELVGVYHKRCLPNYGVFDEQRWFAPGNERLTLYEIAGVHVGLSVCEDLWIADGPIADQARAGAQIVVNINASPYSARRLDERIEVVRERVDEAHCAIAYVNQVGGQDELVFDGGSVVVDEHGELLAAAAQFEDEMLVVDIDVETGGQPSSVLPVVVLSDRARDPDSPVREGEPPARLSLEQEVYDALVLGTHDYMAKNGFTDAVIGLSGGIDSSLVATLAVDALGAKHVHGLAMPSRYSSEGSTSDAVSLAHNLGIDIHTVSIEEVHSTFARTLAPVLDGPPQGLSDENLQSRIRGVLLMAVSNSTRWIVLTTGNKSELATGYSTLYGDSAGGFAVIKDVPKTLVYRLCRYRNEAAGKELVPESVLTKAPSAELRADQKDVDSLPPYEVLDPILEAIVDHDRSIDDVVAAGFDVDTVTRVARLVDAAEYKRRQSPPGVRISMKAFGKDRRMPITNRYRDKPSAERADLRVGEIRSSEPAGESDKGRRQPAGRASGR